MTTVEHAETHGSRGRRSRVARAAPTRPRGGRHWWRHVVALFAMLFALFPVAYVVSAAFNADQTLGGASLIPRDFTLDNFRELLSGEVPQPGDRRPRSRT